MKKKSVKPELMQCLCNRAIEKGLPSCIDISEILEVILELKLELSVVSELGDFVCKNFSGGPHNYSVEETGMKVLKADSLTNVLKTETIILCQYRIQF